jgi:putative hydrolase
MLKVDLHSHSSFSNCGCHSVIEMLHHAKALGMEALAITDHGPATGDHIPTPYFERMQNPVPGIHLFKGMECNLLEEKGKIDVLFPYLRFMDVVLLGIHPNTPTGLGRDLYTSYLLAAMERNPYIDILTHLNTPCYPVDFISVATAATQKGIAIELNNSKTALRRCPDIMALNLLAACREVGARMVVNSDAHCLHEIGQDQAARRMLSQAGFPEEMIINQNLQKTLNFVEERRIWKQK